MKHLGSLESTQEARVAQGILLHIFCAFQTSRVLHTLYVECMLTHEPIMIMMILMKC